MKLLASEHNTSNRCRGYRLTMRKPLQHNMITNIEEFTGNNPYSIRAYSSASALAWYFSLEIGAPIVGWLLFGGGPGQSRRVAGDGW